jgi:hypothetical protein
MDLTEYLKKAGIPEGDIKARQMARIINYMVLEGIIPDVNYGQFISMIYQFKRIIDGHCLWPEPKEGGGKI